jgi:hypothetical protein
LLFADSDVVWNDVLNMDDPIRMDYSALEEMFSRKSEEPVISKEAEKKKTTEVA